MNHLNKLKKFVSELSTTEKIWNGVKLAMILVAVGSLFIKSTIIILSRYFDDTFLMLTFVSIVAVAIVIVGYLFYRLFKKRIELKEFVVTYLSAIAWVALFCFIWQMILVLGLFIPLRGFDNLLANILGVVSTAVLAGPVFILGIIAGVIDFIIDLPPLISFELVGFGAVLVSEIIFWFFIFWGVKVIYKIFKRGLKKK